MKDVPQGTGPTTERRSGRRPGSTSSRPRVRAAAAQLFAVEGYTATTIRAIGDAAEVDSALVVRFYGGKEQLFAAVLEDLEVNLPDLQSVLLASDQAARRRRLAEIYFGVWESAASGNAARALVRGAVGAPRATEMVRGPLERQLFSSMSQPEFGLAMASLFGIAVTRYILQVGPLAEMSIEMLVELAAGQIQIP